MGRFKMEEKRKITRIRQNRILKKAAVGVLLGALAFGVPTAALTIGDVQNTYAAETVGSESSPKLMKLNTDYSNKTTRLSGKSFTDYYYFKTDNNGVNNQYDINVTNNNADASVEVTIEEKGGGCYERYYTKKNDGKNTCTLYLKNNKEYTVRVYSSEQLDYKLSVSHKTSTGTTSKSNTIGSESDPKFMNLNTNYSNNYNLTDYDLYDYYYFKTDNNSVNNEYNINVQSPDKSVYVVVSEQGGGYRDYMNVYPNEGVVTITAYLEKNKVYYVRLSSSRILNYKLSVTHKADSSSSSTTKNIVKYYNGVWRYFNNNGEADYSYTGVAKTTNGNYVFCRNGKYDPSYSGVARSTSGNWVYVKKGRYYTGYTGVAQSTTGNWVYVKNGRYYTGVTGVARSTSGNYVYVKNGRYYTKFTGLTKSLSSGDLVYVKNGRYYTGYNGKAVYNGKTYTVRNGRV